MTETKKSFETDIEKFQRVMGRDPKQFKDFIVLHLGMQPIITWRTADKGWTFPLKVSRAPA